jgi:hypothetical protein
MPVRTSRETARERLGRFASNCLATSETFSSKDAASAMPWARATA